MTWVIDTAAPSSTAALPRRLRQLHRSRVGRGLRDERPLRHLLRRLRLRRRGRRDLRSGRAPATTGTAPASRAPPRSGTTRPSRRRLGVRLRRGDFPADGSYTVRVRATDDAGNVAERVLPHLRLRRDRARDELIDFPPQAASTDAGSTAARRCRLLARNELRLGSPSRSLDRRARTTGRRCSRSPESYFTAPRRNVAASRLRLAADGYTARQRRDGNTGDGPSGASTPSTRARSTASRPPARPTTPPAGTPAARPNGACGTYSDSGSGVAEVEVSAEARRDRPLLGRRLLRRGLRDLPPGHARRRQLVARLPGGQLPRRRLLHPPRPRDRRRRQHRERPGRTFTFDTTAPQTTIDSSPSHPTSSTSADFDFSSSEGGSTFECRLDGGAWGACTSPKSYAEPRGRQPHLPGARHRPGGQHRREPVELHVDGRHDRPELHDELPGRRAASTTSPAGTPAARRAVSAGPTATAPSAPASTRSRSRSGATPPVSTGTARPSPPAARPGPTRPWRAATGRAPSRPPTSRPTAPTPSASARRTRRATHRRRRAARSPSTEPLRRAR